MVLRECEPDRDATLATDTAVDLNRRGRERDGALLVSTRRLVAATSAAELAVTMMTGE
jgi:hypothetical protein